MELDVPKIFIDGHLGNLRLQEMMAGMVVQRGGTLYAIDDKYCIDNGAMIACAGALSYQTGTKIPAMEDTAVTQRYFLLL